MEGARVGPCQGQGRCCSSMVDAPKRFRLSVCAMVEVGHRGIIILSNVQWGLEVLDLYHGNTHQRLFFSSQPPWHVRKTSVGGPGNTMIARLTVGLWAVAIPA
jgi:hypothetical protein